MRKIDHGKVEDQRVYAFENAVNFLLMMHCVWEQESGKGKILERKSWSRLVRSQQNAVVEW